MAVAKTCGKLLNKKQIETSMLKLIDKIPLLPLGLLAAFMSVAPIKPMPHLIEKSGMLLTGSLSRPIDIFDLFLHSIFLILFIIRLLRLSRS